MRNCVYIAADFDHDADAVEQLKWMNRWGIISFNDAHELKQSYDSSLPCSIKKSLQYRMNNSYKFVLIVGSHTDSISKGGCQLCDSYNADKRYCTKGYSLDYRSFVKFECDQAVKAGLQIVVLYNGASVNRELCPASVRWEGTHQNMLCYDPNGGYCWNNDAIVLAMK